MPGQLGTHLQESPKWMQDYIQELIAKSRGEAAKRYVPHQRVNREQNEGIRQKIAALSEKSKEKGPHDIVPFSITGKSKPINISPQYLQKISSDPGFAKRVYEKTTGHQLSRDELQDLMKRAKSQFDYELTHSRQFVEILNNPVPSDLSPQAKQAVERLTEEGGQGYQNIAFDIPIPRQWGKPLLVTLGNARRILDDPGYGNQLYERAYKKPAEKDQLQQLRQSAKKLVEEYSHPHERENQQDIIGRLAAERKIKKLQGQRGTIAPMNELHERATSMLERSFDDDTMKLAGDELRDAKRHNELQTIEPFVMHSLQDPSDEYMNKYVNDYTQDIRRAMVDESEEQYLEHIAPKINMSFAQMGAFHSGARNRALQDALSKHRTKLHRELAHLTGHARDKAMEHHELKKRREQSAAGLMGGASRSQREASEHQAELLRQQAVTKQGMSQLNASALGQVARAKQEQEQHEIDAERQERARHELYPQEQLAREAALVSGLPMPASQTIASELQAAPPPPNLMTLGAGALGALASNFMPQQQQQRPFKAGGSVRKNYADGGHVGDDIGHEMRNMMHEQHQANQAHLQQASQYNPMQSWLRHVGNEMLSNPQEDPLISLGRGTAASFNHRDATRERAANLYDKIQNTRMNQYKVLAEYENMKQKHSLHEKDLSERQKYHQQSLALRQQQLSQKTGAPLIGAAGNEFTPISSKKEREDILKEKKASESVLKDLESIKKLSHEYEEYSKNLFVSPRNPIMGEFASKVQGKYSNITNNKGMRKAAVAKAALDSKLEKFKINIESKMRKGVLPEGMRQFMEKKEVFPSSSEPLDIYNKKMEELIEETRNMYEASKESLKRGIHISAYDLNRSSKEMAPEVSGGQPWYAQLGGSPADE